MSRHWRTLDRQPTRIIAHRGASGPLPEHTLAAYRLARAQGADVIEPDLVVSADGVLVVRHDAGLARSTDIASRPEFATRRESGDWPVDHLRADEIQCLRARQPFAQRDPSHDGLHPVPSLADVIAWAEAEAQLQGGPVTLYPEIKHPGFFAGRGHDPVACFIRQAREVDARRVRLWVQCFEVEPLRRVKQALDLPVHLLLDADADWRVALRRHGAWLEGFGVAKSLLHDAYGRDAGLVEAAHAAGLALHAWTYRDDVLPAGVTDVETELQFAFGLGVDAVFCDFPATGLKARARWAADSGSDS